jgi:uncharacterized protein
MAVRFILRKNTDGNYHFRLVAPNGQAIAMSQSFKHKASALSGMISARENFPGAEVEDQTGDEARITGF